MSVSAQRGSALFLTLILLLALTVLAASGGWLSALSEKLSRAERERQFALGSAEHAQTQIRSLGLAQVTLLAKAGQLPECKTVLESALPTWADAEGGRDAEGNWAWTGLAAKPLKLAGICYWTAEGQWQGSQLQAPDRLVYDCAADNCKLVSGSEVPNLYRQLDGGNFSRAGEIMLANAGLADVDDARQSVLSARFFIEVFNVNGCGDLPAFRVTTRSSGEGGNDAPARARRTVEAIYLTDDLHGGCAAP